MLGPLTVRAQLALDLRKAWSDLVELRHLGQRADETDGEHRPDAHHLVGQRLHPPGELGLRALTLHRRQSQLHQLGGPVEVLGGQGVLDGAWRIAVGRQPVGGPAVHRCHAVRILATQVRAQHVGEQLVVPVPLASVVQWDEEQVGPLQLTQHRGSVGSPGDRVAQRAGEAVEDARVEQKGADVRRKPVQHLVDQVVDDEPVVAGELRHGRAGIVPALQRQCRQLERRCPTFGAVGESGDVGVAEGEIHRVGEVVGRLLLGEAQIRRPHLDELAAGAQPREWQRRVGTGGDHQMDVGGEMVEQVGDPVVDLLALDDVVVVEDEHQLVVQRVEVVHQRGQGRVGRGRGRAEDRERGCAERGAVGVAAAAVCKDVTT